jgi:integrase
VVAYTVYPSQKGKIKHVASTVTVSFKMNEISDSLKDSLFDFKSRKIYQKWIDKYNDWFTEREYEGHTAFTVLGFFKSIDLQYSSNTMWQCHSALSKYLLVYHNISIKENLLIKDFLKKKGKTHLEKNSKILSKEECDKFFETATDEGNFVLIKCAIAIGIFGLSRVSELVDLLFSDVKLKDNVFQIYIKQSKTDCKKQGFTFFVIQPYAKYIQNYLNLFDGLPTGRFFRRLGLNNSPTDVPIGKNTLASYPSKVAEFLDLPDYKSYTGHCLRRSGATMLADSGVSKITLKRAGRWKSDTVCDGYVDESSASKFEIANALVSAKPLINDLSVIPNNPSANSIKNVYISDVTGNIVLNV